MKLLYSQHINSTARKSFLFLALGFIFSLSAQAQGTSKELVFKNAYLASGVAGADGAVYRFNNVDSKLDALVKIVKRSDAKVKLLSIDINSGGWDKAFQPQVTYNNNTTPSGISDWYMEFDITFLLRETNTVATIGQFDCTAIDIDGNGDLISENVTFFHFDSYTLEANSLLNINNIDSANMTIGKKFQGPVINFVSIDTSGTPVMVTVKYKDKSKITIRAGAHAAGANSAADRLYAFWFKSFNYNSAETNILPLKMNSFNAKLNSNKVLLNWEVSEQNNISHYIVERSLDGYNYNEAGVVFANEEGVNRYKYTDMINLKPKGLVYYRLRAVSIIGNYMFSATRMIRMDDSKSLTVDTYPNPFTNELRISVPQAWQEKSVSYELYNVNGQLIRRLNAQRAGQTEVMDVKDVASGNYLIRVSSASGTISQQLLKGR